MHTCYFEYFENAWSCPALMIVWTFRKLWCLSTCKKTILSLTSFLGYYTDIMKNCCFVSLSNLGMACHTHLNDSLNLRKHLTFICRQKITFILHIFLELLFYCKDIVNLLWLLLGMPGYADQTWYYQVIYRKLLCLSAGKKPASSSMLCWRLPAFWPKSWEPEFYQTWDWW